MVVTVVPAVTWDDVAVLRHGGAYRLVTARPVAAGAALFTCLGAQRSEPSRYSVQIERDRHVDLPEGAGAEEILDAYPWRFLNHSCAPTARLVGPLVVALEDLAAFTEITFDYDANEWDMATPFDCGCRSASCRGVVRGFRHLSMATRQALRSRLSQHLLARFDEI